MQVTVLTATIPGRERLLAEAMASVYAQTSPAYVHLVSGQAPGAVGPTHCAAQRNRLLPSVSSDWIAVLNDDDLWLPHHLATLAVRADEADVIYSWETSNFLPRLDVSDWPQEQLIERFDDTNFLDANVLIRTNKLKQVGGWSTDWVGGHWQDGGHYRSTHANREDWELWQRLSKAGARFRCVPEETWTYRAGDWSRDSTDLWGAS